MGKTTNRGEIVGPWLGNVMLIDDSDTDRLQCERLLAKSGIAMRLFRYEGAREALRDLIATPRGRQRPNLVLLDLHMPAMDGFEFLAAAAEALGESVADLNVIMMTTDIVARDQARAAHFPAVRMVLDKPLSRADFERAAAFATGSTH
ncbi:MAG: response regulator [Pseudomonadota bacterium]